MLLIQSNQLSFATANHAGPSAYSSLAAGRDGTIYLLFERGSKKLYESVAVARFNLAWLTIKLTGGN